MTASARPREGGDPEKEDWIPAYAGMSGNRVTSSPTEGWKKFLDL